MVGKNVQICGVHINRKCICDYSKNMKIAIFTYAPQAKFPIWFLSSPLQAEKTSSKEKLNH